MGSSHSVFILMNINLQIIGRQLNTHWCRDPREQALQQALADLARDGAGAGPRTDSSPEAEEEETDEAWLVRHHRALHSAASSIGFSVEQWMRAAR